MSAALRNMILQDLEQITLLERLCFAIPWSREMIRKEIADNTHAHYMLLEEDGQIVAYGGFWKVLDEGHITNMAVHPQWRSQGLGERMLRSLMEAAKALGIQKMTLEVRPSNAHALALYEKLGFAICGRRKGYYSDNHEDALVMWCDL